MWKLKHTKKDHIENYLLVGEEFIVGRKDCNLLITNDPSLSRRHAVLFVKHPEGNLSDPSKKSSLFLRDEGSKYGTFRNGSRVATEVELLNNDVLKFGQFESEFRVHCEPLVVTTSCLEVSGKKELKKSLHILGGHLISEWQPSCTHLAMTEIKVTVKAMCCLVSAKPIVKPEYFLELKTSLKDSTFVQPNMYVPPIGEDLIDKEKVSFDINPHRKTLFKDKTFFFIDEKQFKKLHLGIILGGGNAAILNSDNMDQEKLLQDDCCVVDPARQSQSSQEVRDLLPLVISTLQKKKLRLIPESDVGLAVAYCSTEKFCNPKFDMGEALHTQRIQSQTLTQREVYVPDTEQKTQRVELKSRSLAADAVSSLHLSSFQIGSIAEMEVSQVPVSAQIKRELDDLFDDPLDIPLAVEPKIEEITSSPPSVQTSKRQKMSLHHQNGQSSKQEINSPERTNVDGEVDIKHNIVQIPEEMPNRVSLKEEEATVNGVQINGITHAEDDLPRNLIKIQFAALICRKPLPQVQQYANSSVKNFKKFRKVLPMKAHALPRIIGARDLVPFDKIAAGVVNDMWVDDPPEENVQPVKGEFDW